MEQVFLQLARMSLAAGWLVLAVLALRLLLKKAPRWAICLLWALVAVRLVCPVTISSRVSLVPRAESVVQTLPQLALPEEIEAAEPAEAVPADAAPQISAVAVASRVWLAGTVGMLLWAVVSDLRLRRRLRVSIPHGEGVRLCDGIDSPFVLGILRPTIYLPSGIDPAQAVYVLAHENAHIARRDHWWKPLGWLLLSVYWFQPLLWAAYVLFCRDLELACDERVAAELDRAGLAAYSEALLRCSRSRRGAALVCPVSFGEVAVRQRVRTILRYKKPALRAVLSAVAVVLAVAALFLTERPAAALSLPETAVTEQTPAPLADNDDLQEYPGQKADLLRAARAAQTPEPTPTPSPVPTAAPAVSTPAANRTTTSTSRTNTPSAESSQTQSAAPQSSAQITPQASGTGLSDPLDKWSSHASSGAGQQGGSTFSNADYLVNIIDEPIVSIP